MRRPKDVRQLPGSLLETRLSRRDVLRRAAGLTALTLLPGPIVSCRPPFETASTGLSATSLGSNFSDPVPRRAIAAVVESFTETTGHAVRINTVDHATFQDQMGSYLQGTPDDVISWFAGNRLRFFADRGLVSEIGGIWERIADRHTEALRRASSGLDGQPYLVPFNTYPWAVVYRRSVFDAHDYAPPGTWEELLALCDRMTRDGLVPFAFGDKDGWPAMGTFDILDLRLNGYDFHIGLMEGRERWTDDRTRSVFETWRALLPHHQEGALGRTWQEAAQGLIAGRAGMYLIGGFVAEQATAEEREDLDLFSFPLLGTEFDDERAIDAPVNGFVLAAEPRSPDAARSFLEFLSTGTAQDIFLEENPSRVATADDADASRYTSFQRSMAGLIESAGRLAQFMDRDSRPDFTGPAGMQSFLQRFLREPNAPLGPLLETIQTFYDSLDE